MIETLDLTHCVSVAREAALLAWEEIRPYFRGTFRIHEKENEGPATDADIAADRAICAYLSQHLPDPRIGLLSEETQHGDERLAHDAVWIIDPIDGTRDFIAGGDEFAVHIGLAARPSASSPLVPVAGVVYMPRAGWLYSASLGGGAWEETVENGARRRLHVTGQDSIEAANLVVTNARIGRRLGAAIGRLKARELLQKGSLGVKAMDVATGRADIYLNTGRRGCKEWDTCAPHIIVEEAGGRLTDLNGHPITYNNRDYHIAMGLVCTNGTLHEGVLQELRAVSEIWDP